MIRAAGHATAANGVPSIRGGMWRKRPRRMWGRMMKNAPEVFCTRCGLAAPIDDGEVTSPCSACGNEIFATLDELGWLAKLTEADREFLKNYKIGAT
jgi:hypothetical protein